MENAVDALKIAFAVFVFVIALALAVSVVGQARATSDIILSLNDRTNYYDYVEQSDNNANEKDRIVDLETILPTIYRYAKEQYAVTILDEEGIPIVRYDLYTEGFMGDWDKILKKQQIASIDNKTDSQYEEIAKRIKIVDNFIYKELKKSENPIMDSLKKGDLYKGKNINNATIHSVAPWMGNPDTDTIYRIQADLGESGTTYERNGVIYEGKNLSSKYKDSKFKEKFLEVQTSGTTVIEPDENSNIEYSLETVKGNKKLEIIYILQK